MKNTLLLVVLGVAAIFPRSITACDCFGNNSYCETLAPTYYLNPEATALVVKLGDYHYGITVRVLQIIDDGSVLNDTLTVWGDNGAICRPYLNWIPIGDTLVFGLNQTDFMGNLIYNSQYPPDLEQPGDYMLSVCGVYWLQYENGLVEGTITEPSVQYMNLQEFATAIAACSAQNGVNEEISSEPVLHYVDGVPVLEGPAGQESTEVRLLDMNGRTVMRRAWNGQPLWLQGFAGGVYAVLVDRGERPWARKVLVGR